MLVRWATLVAWFSSAWVAALLAGAQQNRTISGTVVDLGTGTPVPANTIVEFKVENINPSVLSTIVTNSGQFIVRNVPRTWSNGITAHVNVGRSPAIYQPFVPNVTAPGTFNIASTEMTIAKVKVCRQSDHACLTRFEPLEAALMSIPYYLGGSGTDLPGTASRGAPDVSVRLALAAFHGGAPGMVAPETVTPGRLVDDDSEDGGRMARLAERRDEVIAKTAKEWGIPANELKNYLNSEVGLILNRDFWKGPQYDLALAYLYCEQYADAIKLVKNFTPEAGEEFRYKVLDAYLLYATGDGDGAASVTAGLLMEHPNDGVLRSNLRMLRKEQAFLKPSAATCSGIDDLQVHLTSFDIPSIQNHPFTATEEISVAWTNKAGLMGCKSMSLRFARNSQGSIHSERGKFAIPVPSAPQTTGTVTDIYVTDPVTQNQTHCPKPDGECQTYPIENPVPRHIFLEPSDVKANGMFICPWIKEDVQGTEPDCEMDDLGTNTIFGVPVRGQRIERKIVPPEDVRGMVQVEQIWYSPDLQLDMLDVRSEYSGASVRIQYWDLKLEEPNPRLFASHQ